MKHKNQREATSLSVCSPLSPAIPHLQVPCASMTNKDASSFPDDLLPTRQPTYPAEGNSSAIRREAWRRLGLMVWRSWFSGDEDGGDFSSVVRVRHRRGHESWSRPAVILAQPMCASAWVQ